MPTTVWNDEEHDLLDGLIQRLEQAWQTAGTADLAQFVPPPGHPTRQTALVALIQTDQELCWQHGRTKTVGDYLAEWPELREQGDCVGTLTASEARLRLESRLGRYEIRGEMGRGGMGTVYRAFDKQLERDVALKIPNCDPHREPAVVERFLHEGKAAARIQHPNVCPIYDAGCIEGTYFLVMALIAGDSLAHWMHDRRPSPEEAAQLIRRLALALQAVHEQGIVHRDIKPSNVMVTPQGEPLLMDFGLARQLDGPGGWTSPGALVGTVPYMSPEQVNGARVDHRSDVYSLGVVLYQLLTGELPFQGTLTDILLGIGYVQPVKPSRLQPGVNSDLESVCLRAMAKKPEERYPSAAELATALEACSTPHTAVVPRARRRPVAVRWGILTAVAAVAILSVVWSRSASRPDLVAEPLPVTDEDGSPLPRELRFEFHLQRKDETVSWQQLNAQALPLRDGDRVQLRASLAREAFIYVYWFDHAGKPQRLYPPRDIPLAGHRKSREVRVPPDAGAGAGTKWLQLQDMRGAETVLVGVAGTPRTAEDLRQIETTYQQVPVRLVPGPRLEPVAYPPLAERRERGVGEIVDSPKDGENPLRTFESVLRQHFVEYQGWVVVNE
jgi:serine/threonine protein kinase